MSLAATLATIARCRPELERDLRRMIDGDDEQVTAAVHDARSGAVTATIGGRHVHSSVDPVREARRLAAALDGEREYDGVIVVGVGLGYHLEALAEELPAGTPIVAVPLAAALVRLALETRGARWWCRSGPTRVCPAAPATVLLDVLESLAVRRPAVVTLPGVAAALPDRAATVSATIERYQRRTRVNRNTLRRFGRLWVRNTLHNARRHLGAPGIEPLEHAVGGMPALVVGAGPTLDEALPHINALARRYLIVAVDTALAPLQRAGVEPDLAVVADPQYWNSRHLDQVRPRTTQLVADLATHPRTLRVWRGATRFSASLFPLGAFIDRLEGRTRRLGAGGSVATSAWDLARLVGAQRILLAGVDLGFPQGRTHCAGSFFEERLIRRATRLDPAEGGMHRYLHGASPRPVPSADGGRILSDDRMQVYRSWFADQALTHSAVETILLSPHSSAIESIEWWPIDRALTAPIAREDPAQRVLPPVDSGDTDTRPAREETLGRVSRELGAAVARLGEVAAAGLATCDEVEATGDPRALQRLDAVDARLVALEEREILGFLAADALESSAGTAPTTVIEAVDQARTMYRELLAAAEFHRTLIERYRFATDVPIL